MRQAAEPGIDRIALVRVTTDFLIVGSGVAGLRAAIALAERGRRAGAHQGRSGREQHRLRAGRRRRGGRPRRLARSCTPATRWRRATGCAAPRPCDVLVHDGPRYVRELLDWGAAFDRDDVGRAGARDARPPTACAGCCTRATPPAARSDACCGPARRSRRACACSTWRWWCALRVDDGVCTGATFIDRAGEVHDVVATRTLLATGGAGQVFRETTNPAVATGDGMAMAFEAGARVADLEFVQFHPTVLSVAGAPRFLLSEALRGEGGRLAQRLGRALRRALRSRRRSGATRRRRPRHRPRADRHRLAGLPLDGPRRSRLRAQALPDDRPGVPRCRSRPGHRSDSGQPGRPLRDGRRRDRSRRPDVGGQPVRGRRGGLHRRARRQPPGQQLAARRAGVRRACRGGHAGTDARRPRSAPSGMAPLERGRRQAGVGQRPTRCAS